MTDNLNLISQFGEGQIINILKKSLTLGSKMGLEKSYDIKNVKIKDNSILVYYRSEIKNKIAIYVEIAQIVGFIHGFIGKDIKENNILHIGVQSLIDNEPYIYILSPLDAAEAIASGNPIYWLKNSIVNEPILEQKEIFFLVEGESEIVAFPLLFERMNYKIDAHRIKIFPFSKNHLKSILLILKYKNDAFYLICDKDKGKEIFDLKREGLLCENFHILKEGEFEDYIKPDALIEILSSFTPNLKITNDYIVKEKEKGLSTSKIISKYYHNNVVKYPVPKKPEVAKKIALFWIQNGLPSEIEDIILDVMNIV